LMACDVVTSLDQLKPSATIGTSSPRRIAQIRHLRPDLRPADIRGNVTTRIRKLEEGKYDAIILARAGLERLGLTHKVSFCFDPDKLLPAAAQGALAVQTRGDDAPTKNLIAALDEPSVRVVTFTERQVLAAMQCGCHAPAGAFARIDADGITIDAFISDIEGKSFIRRQITGLAQDAQNLAETLARQLLDSGGKIILQKLQAD
ncbi:MAG: hydroxymethylbilane synthase, partial [Planctomycetota bacterium]